MNAFSKLAAIVIGLVTWPLTLTILKSGANFSKPTDLLMLLVFLTPVIYLLVRAFATSGEGGLFWWIALAPILGAINLLLAVLIMLPFGKLAASEFLAQFGLALFWVVLTVKFILQRNKTPTGNPTDENS